MTVTKHYMKKSDIVEYGVMVDYVGDLNFGQTVDIIGDALYPEPGYMIQPHGDKRTLYVPRNSVAKGEDLNGRCKLNPRYENSKRLRK